VGRQPGDKKPAAPQRLRRALGTGEAGPDSCSRRASCAIECSTGNRTGGACMEARGHNGQAAFDGQFVTITRRGFLARASVGKGTKRIPVSQIAAVQWKPAGPLVNGFIQFTLPGGMERRSRMGRQTKSAVDDENSVIFTRSQMPAFDQLRAAIEAELAARNAPAHRRVPQATQQDPAAQLRKLGELRQGGLISDLEYAAKREEIISRL